MIGYLVFMGVSSLRWALLKKGALMEDYPLKEPDYFEDHIKMCWVDNRKQDSTFEDFSAVSSYVSAPFKVLEKHRFKWLPWVPENLTAPNIPLKLKDLFIQSKEWRKVVTDIETEVMPLFLEYGQVIHASIPPTLASFLPSTLPPSQSQASGSSLHLPFSFPQAV